MTPDEKATVDKYERLKSLTSTDGWKDIEEFMTAICLDAMDSLINPKADRQLDNYNRASIACITSLMHMVRNDYEFGRVLRERFANKTMSRGE